MFGLPDQPGGSVSLRPGLPRCASPRGAIPTEPEVWAPRGGSTRQPRAGCAAARGPSERQTSPTLVRAKAAQEGAWRPVAAAAPVTRRFPHRFPDLGSPASSQRWSRRVGRGSNRGPAAQQRQLSGRPLWTQAVLHPCHLLVALSPASRLRPLGAHQVFAEHANEEVIAVSLYFWVSYSLDICLYPKPPLPPPVYIDLC